MSQTVRKIRLRGFNKFWNPTTVLE